MPSPVVVTVPARAALAGNPSDLYAGAVLAVPVTSLRARVEVIDAADTRIVGDVLVDAAIARAPAGRAPFDLRWSTTIPRSVGLAGSSAIVVATLRALFERAATAIDDLDLALLAQAVEADDLGIVAGLQDRAAQAFGQPVLVDVSRPTPRVTPLAPARPLRIAIAWLDAAAADSGNYHQTLKERAPGAMDELADVARAAAAEFAAGSAAGLAVLMAESADIRARVAPLPDAHARLAAAVTNAGLRPNSAGSGGAIAAVVLDDDALARVILEVRELGGDLVVETYG